MAGRKCYTYIWKIENANYAEFDDGIVSPLFQVDEVNETIWELELQYYAFKDCPTDLNLRRRDDGAEKVEIDCEFAYLSSNGTVLHSVEKRNSFVGKYESVKFSKFPSLEEATWPLQDTLTVRCRMWKSGGEIDIAVQLFARTRILVERRSFVWNIRNFSSFVWDDRAIYEINSLESNEQLMRLELSVTRNLIFDERILLKIIPNYKNIKVAALELFTVNASKNNIKCFQCEFSAGVDTDSEVFTLFQSKEELTKRKNELLPNGVLSLLCKCTFSTGNIVNEFEGAISNCSGIENLENLNKSNDLPVPKEDLIKDLKSMLNNDVLSDVKLKTRNKTYPAHKFILGVRSPVFKSMFSTHMKENINDCVDIDDFSDETVLHMLRYIYCSDVEDLDWGRATELYEAGDKYEILSLKDACTSYLKSNLCSSNACEALVLADLHQDEDLKRFVQDFILRHENAVIRSEEWDQLMKTHLMLAAETMRLNFLS